MDFRGAATPMIKSLLKNKGVRASKKSSVGFALNPLTNLGVMFFSITAFGLTSYGSSKRIICVGRWMW